ncbi:MAG: DUF3098 domain-containing protein [Melioribacteraceae bacterium]|nr:DUF3098 domain-containing protein [Melioribacteraceae bacterium]MCF8264451.1 DUF3098 domain-containing protein [Melioribacteraceae bacterium]
MAKRKIRKKVKNQNSRFQSPFASYWSKTNFILLFTGIGILILGYYLMNVGPWDNPISLTISPLLLLFAYLVVFPAAILYKQKGKQEDQNVSGES